MLKRKKNDLKFEYIKGGWYKCVSDSGKTYYLRPRDAFCTCPATKTECRHLKDLYSRLKDKGVGIE